MTTMKELIQRQKMAALSETMAPPPGLERPAWMLEELVLDPYWTEERYSDISGAIIGRGGDCRWIMVRMAFNWRLIGVPEEREESNPEYGWCFPGLTELKLACFAWDPETQDEPLGWHKRAGSPRRARHRHQDLAYNRPRCVHGSYLTQASCAVDEFCGEFKERALR